MLVRGDFNIIQWQEENNSDNFNDRCPFIFNVVIKILDLKEIILRVGNIVRQEGGNNTKYFHLFGKGKPKEEKNADRVGQGNDSWQGQLEGVFISEYYKKLFEAVYPKFFSRCWKMEMMRFQNYNRMRVIL
jgi:hypothetical protein